MPIQLFVSLIEFKLTTLAGFVLVPFGLFGRTAFLAERVLGNVVSSGIKILVLAVIIGIGSTIFNQFTSGFNNPPTISDALTLILASLFARSHDLRPRHCKRSDRRWAAARRRRRRRNGPRRGSVRRALRPQPVALPPQAGQSPAHRRCGCSRGWRRHGRLSRGRRRWRRAGSRICSDQSAPPHGNRPERELCSRRARGDARDRVRWRGWRGIARGFG